MQKARAIELLLENCSSVSLELSEGELVDSLEGSLYCLVDVGGYHSKLYLGLWDLEVRVPLGLFLRDILLRNIGLYVPFKGLWASQSVCLSPSRVHILVLNCDQFQKR